MTLPYAILRPFIFQLDAEKAHGLAIRALARGWVPVSPSPDHASLKQTLFGLDFDNPVGLAAGFDKNAEAVIGLAKQGFGFIEVGTVTPKPQAGNPTPRIFRLQKDEAIINRLGFNNEGASAMHQRLQNYPEHSMIIGVNIGRNKDCPDAVADYQTLLTQMADVADYITINISSPNTQGLRDMQQKRQLGELLSALNQAKAGLSDHRQQNKPLLLKIAPDIDQATTEDIAELAITHNLSGLIISNTTIKRPNTLKSAQHGETGGLSGRPLMHASTKLLANMYQLTNGQIPLIGVGGIASAEDAYQKILAGASLVQLYSALAYQGFGLIKRINQGLIARLERDGFKHVSEAVGTGPSLQANR